MPSKFRGMKILGSGHALPKARLLSTDIDTRLGRPQGWTERHTGIASRYVCETEDQIDLAELAACRALAAAGYVATDVDLLIFAAAVPYQSIPATAPLLQRRLGIPDGRCAAFDVNSTCLSFLTASDIAASFLAGGSYSCCLVVSSEIASRGLPWETDPLVASLFGDGAAAALLTPGDGTAGVVAARMETHPSGYEDCALGAGGTRYDFHRDPAMFARHAVFEMDGRALFRHTVSFFGQFLERLLDTAGWRREDVDLVVPHQASPIALSHLAERCGFGSQSIINIMHDHGNQIAASIPTALDFARSSGRLADGMRMLMLGTSAGLSFGGLAMIV